MTNEISEEAKRTLADLPRRKALQRLERDGAQSGPAMVGSPGTELEFAL